MMKPPLLGRTPGELAELLAGMGQPAFRAKQLFGWLHKGASFDQMSNLPLPLRETLQAQFDDRPVRILETHVSRIDGTRKYLFAMRDGNCVEGVLMRYRHGLSFCLSTQVGCRMGCAFCASTLEGLVRNLGAAEMLHMLLLVEGELRGERLRNLVLMGSGEPLDNYDQLLRFLTLVSHPEGMQIGLRHISLSTCGLVDRMRAFADEGLPVTLSVSLHAPNDAIRQQTMPVAKAWPMDKLLDACRYYIEKTGRRVIFEYALIDGVNNRPEHARELAQRLRGIQCHVNLIPLNEVKERRLRSVSQAQARAFLQLLEGLQISATLRRELGDDIGGACGQLRQQRLKAGAALAPDMSEEEDEA